MASVNARAPLGHRSERGRGGAPGGLQGFRRSLMAPPAVRIDSARISTDFDDVVNGENRPNQRPIAADAQQQKKLKQRVRFGVPDEQENGSLTTTLTKSPTATQPIGLSAFRQSLGSTLSTPAKSSSSLVPRMPTPGPSARPLPPAMTPTSLLKEELSEAKDLDESLLCSPAPLLVRARRVGVVAGKNSMGPPVRIQAAPLPKAVPASLAGPSRSTMTMQLSEPTRAVNKILEQKLEPNACAVNREETKPRPAKVKAKSVLTVTKPSEPTVLAKSKSLVALKQERAKPPTGKAPAAKPPPALTIAVPPPTTTYQAPPTVDVHAVKTALPSVMRVAGMPSPFTPRGNGVCMDLSDMFFDAATATKSRPLRDKVPRSMARSGRRSLSLRPRVVKTETVSDNVRNVEEEWAQKQCETFANWLNYTIQPTEDSDHAATLEGEIGTVEDRAAHRTLLLHQRTAAARREAAELFKSREMGMVRSAIESEIARGRLAIRKDRNLYADLTVRRKVLDLLLSYSTPWLRLGLETLLGNPIQPDTPHHSSPGPQFFQKTQKKIPLSRMKATLRNFIVQNVLSDEIILAKYTKGKCKLPSGKFEEQYNTEMRTVVLYRLMVLFFFLDRAKEANVLSKHPCLFTKDSAVKSSKDVLLSFCRDFLSAEGNFMKHLGRVGLNVFYKQEPIEELDFTITNFATDLRDGVKLARMMEIVTNAPRKSLLSKLRLPAVSRLQKLHNVGLVLKTLRSFGVPIYDDVASHHIVDGHREMVLKLMWFVVSHCCLKDLLSAEALHAEIRRISRGRSMPVEVSDELSVGSDASGFDELRPLLLQWCQVVCATSGVVVTNLTEDLADGKALCLLMNYYHPHLLRIDEIKPTTRDLTTTELLSEGAVDRARDNERFNAGLMNKRMSELGGIPKMVPECDSSLVPDEKTMVLCLSFLCSRLLESRGEVRACVLIQQCYRRYRAAIEARKKAAAALVIWAAWRLRRFVYYVAQRKKYREAVMTIEQFVSENWSRLVQLKLNRIVNEQMRDAATIIQAFSRGRLAQRSFQRTLQLSSAAVVCQSMWRSYQTRRMYLMRMLQLQSARVIQRAWWNYKCNTELLPFAATQIQRVWRGFCAVVLFHMDLMDVVAVQSCVRRRLAINERRRRAWAFQTIQAFVRECLARRQAVLEEQRSSAALQCQCAVRQFLAVKKLCSLRESRSSRLIQSAWRRYVVQRDMVVTHTKARLLQARIRCWRVLRTLRHQHSRASLIQAHLRAWLACSQYQRLLSAVVVCQKRARGLLAEKEASRRRLCRNAATVIQSAYRRHRSFVNYESQRHAAVRIEAITRTFLQRHQYTVIVTGVRRFQALHRRFLTLMEFKTQVARIVTCQRACRAFVARAVVERRKTSVVLIQGVARRFLAVLVFSHLRAERRLVLDATTRIQSIWRSCLEKGRFEQKVARVVKIQAMVRRQAALRRRRQKIHATTVVQLALRCQWARKNVEALREARDKKIAEGTLSCTALQRHFRGYVVRRELLVLHTAATMIQKVFRGFIAWIVFKMDVADICLVQSLVRMRQCRTQLSHRKLAVLCLQSAVRCFQARQLASRLRTRKLFLLRLDMASVAIQRVYRGYEARCRCIEQAAARSIQKTWRCYTIHVDFMLSLLAAIKIQAAWRRHATKLLLDRKVAAAIILQSVARRAIAQRSLQQLHRLAGRMQSVYRMSLQRRAYLLQKRAGTIVQRYVRGYFVRVELEIESFAACEIQRIWRGRSSLVNYVWSLLAVIKMQAAVRRFLACVLLEQMRLSRSVERFVRARSVRLIQTNYRGYLDRRLRANAAQSIQVLVRHFLSKLSFAKLRRSVVRMQSIARGKQVRRRRSKQLAIRASRLRKANLKAAQEPHLRLGNRTQSALEHLLKSTRLAEIMTAICTLEMATRLSEKCCIAFADTGAADILFSLIRQCNRSLPHIELLRHILLTMWNVARYDALVLSMASQLGAEILLDLVQLFRDKDGVFVIVARLLEKVVRCNEDLQSICRTKENLKRLKAINVLCMRKTTVATGSRTPLGHSNLNMAMSKPPIKGFRSIDDQQLREGIRALQRLIRLVDNTSS